MNWVPKSVTSISLRATSSWQMARASMLRACSRPPPTLEVLVMSGYTERSPILDGRMTPGDHLLRKPFPALTLPRAVAEHLRHDADVPADP